MNTKYMIHACEARMWYVEEFLVPSMTDQGIPEENIEIWCDHKHDGCLKATIDSFYECGKREGGIWHLQDDVAISRDFAQKTAEHDDGIVHGFFFRHIDECDLNPGKTSIMKMGYSFPCCRIPNDIAREFVDWYREDGQFRDDYQEWIRLRKHVDTFFRDFLRERHSDGFIYNLKPSIVEHVDYLIGGSTVNKWRIVPARATYFEDYDIIENLKDRIAHRK